MPCPTCGAVALGAGQGPALTNRLQGRTGSEEQVALTTDHLPAHSHGATSMLRTAASPAVTASPASNYLAEPNNANLYAGAFDLTTMGPQSVGTVLADTGQNQPHTNMMPFLNLRYIMATAGFYPSSED